MPVYRYRCEEHGQWEGWRSIHIDSLTSPCPECQAPCAKVFVVPAITSRHPATIEINEREARWADDMDAYKRLRHDGVQPKGIDGSAALEAGANTETEINMGKLLPFAQVKEGAERSAEILGHEVVDA